MGIVDQLRKEKENLEAKNTRLRGSLKRQMEENGKLRATLNGAISLINVLVEREGEVRVRIDDLRHAGDIEVWSSESPEDPSTKILVARRKEK